MVISRLILWNEYKNGTIYLIVLGVIRIEYSTTKEDGGTNMANEKYAKQDKQLFYHVERLQAGYVDSYNEIYNLSRKYIYKIIYDIVQDYHTTEDI